MSYESRAYDNAHGDPVVVLVATGTHDVSRLVNLLNGGSPNCEQRGLGHRVLGQVRRHNAGRLALELLRSHGGPDFTTPDEATEDEVRQLLLAISDPGAFVKRGDDYAEPIPAWSARAVVAAGWRPTGGVTS